MTGREEIERLLNQTGRTLEGLPEKHGTADVIDCITIINAGQGAYRRANVFAERILHQSDVIELLVGALRDALDERDAAIKDLPRMCYLCKHCFSNPMIKDTKLGKMIIHCDKNCSDARFWEWRGQKKEAAAWES